MAKRVYKTSPERREYMRQWRLKNGIKPMQAEPPICGHTDRRRKGDQVCRKCYIKKHRFEFLLRHRYGITEETYWEKHREQNGVCAICFSVSQGGRRLSVDHSHSAGTVRGLLCVRCNAGLGNFLEQSELLLSAVKYLGRWCQQ